MGRLPARASSFVSARASLQRRPSQRDTRCHRPSLVVSMDRAFHRRRPSPAASTRVQSAPGVSSRLPVSARLRGGSRASPPPLHLASRFVSQSRQSAGPFPAPVRHIAAPTPRRGRPNACYTRLISGRNQSRRKSLSRGISTPYIQRSHPVQLRRRRGGCAKGVRSGLHPRTPATKSSGAAPSDRESRRADRWTGGRQACHTAASPPGAGHCFPS